jgi:DNA polymerase delta subunit 1
VRNVFTLQKCAPIVGSKVYSFEKEQDLLTKWRDFVVAVDPDIITGYNIVNFDFPYIIDRANVLGITKYASFSKLKHSLSKVKSTTLNSKAFGIRDSKDINIEGRI